MNQRLIKTFYPTKGDSLSANHGPRLWKVSAASLLMAVYMAPSLLAGTGLAERERVRLQAQMTKVEDLVAQGDAAVASGDYALAVEKYRSALASLPLTASGAERRPRIVESFVVAAIDRAHIAATTGHYDEARALLQEVSKPDLAPNDERVHKLLAQIDDPEWFNPAMSPAHTQRVQEVTRLLHEANGHYDLAEFDLARATFNRVLTLDRTNVAARRGLERTEKAISKYHLASREHTRAKALREVDEAWETPAVAIGNLGSVGTGDLALGGEGLLPRHSLQNKLQAIRLPRIEFDQAPLDEVVQYLIVQSKNFDNVETDPARKGINIVITNESGLSKKRISLSLNDVPLEFVIQSVANVAGTTWRADDYVVSIGQGSATDLVTRTYKVPPSFFTQNSSTEAGNTSGGIDDAITETSGTRFVRMTAQEILTQNGVVFTEGSSAFYSPANSTLTFRGTISAHDALLTLINSSEQKSPKLVNVRVAMLEVTQENLEELGYDWLLGQFDLAGGVFASGGTPGNTASGDQRSAAQNFPFIAPGQASPVGQYPLTAGNRSGNAALPSQTIDALLRGQRRTDRSIKAPAVFALSGVLTDPQMQVVMRGLSQKKAVDISSAPSIVTRSGQRAKVQVIREFPYPTEFEPPEIPQDFGSSRGQFALIGRDFAVIGSLGGANASRGFPVTPTTPTTFESKNVGNELEIEAVVSADGQTIDLDVAPIYRAFEGFINYGTPIQVYPDGTTPVTLTDNRIQQPVFRTNKANGIRVTINSGSTMVIAGLAQDERTKIEDKTPVLGDLPYIGRFFRSSIDKYQTKNIIFMVTAKVIDPSGLSPSVNLEAPPARLDSNVTALPQ